MVNDNLGQWWATAFHNTVVSHDDWLALRQRMLDVAAELRWGACKPCGTREDGWHRFHFEGVKRAVDLPPYRTEGVAS
jgi:hypothetical protein